MSRTLFATLAVIAAGMLAAGLLISRAARTLHNTGYSAPEHRASSTRPRGSADSPRAPRPDTAPRAHSAPAPGASPRAPGTPPHSGTREAGPQRPGAKRSGGLLGSAS